MLRALLAFVVFVAGGCSAGQISGSSSAADAAISTVPDAPTSTVPDARVSGVPDARVSSAPDARVTGVADAPVSNPADAPSGSIPLAWMAPTTNADGSPLTDLAGYKLHYDTTGRGQNASYVYANTIDIGMPSCSAVAGGTECHYDTPDFGGAPGTSYYLTVTGYDKASPPNESAYSNELKVTR